MSAHLLKIILGHSQGWVRIQRANEFHQRPSLALMGAIGKQLRPLMSPQGDGSLLEQTVDRAAGLTVHQPYATLPGPGER